MSERVTVEQHVGQSAGAALGSVFGAIAAASRDIERKIRLAGLSDIYGALGTENVQGEQQQKLDVFANVAMISALSGLETVAAAVSEEDEEPVVFDHAQAKYVVIFDPLDGSSNIDVNVNVGTIVSVQAFDGRDVTASAMQPGAKQVAAAYVVYGPSTVMVVTTGAGVAAFTLDA